MGFEFEVIPYDSFTFLDLILPAIPKATAVYRIYDRNDQLIVLNRTSNLFQRLERFFGERTELVRDLDLRLIAARIEFVRTYSPFETTYVLYLERRRHFPKTYRKMRTFSPFTLMKINRRQRFPRIYASREIKAGVDYFGPFVSRAQFTRLKTTLERTFKLRPCLYNIRGNDPHPDCMYFQMHTCSRPCNNDIGRSGYLEDVQSAIAFVRGRDGDIERGLVARITELAAETRFEEAETLRRKLEKIRRARQEFKETFTSIWEFDCLVVAPAGSASRCRMAFVRSGVIVAFEEYAVAGLDESLPAEIRRIYEAPAVTPRRDWQYDEFCLVAGYLVRPLQSVHVIPISTPEETTALVTERLREGRRRRTRTGQQPEAGVDHAVTIEDSE